MDRDCFTKVVDPDYGYSTRFYIYKVDQEFW